MKYAYLVLFYSSALMLVYCAQAQLPQDIYVHPEGSDDDTGLSWQQPLRTLQKALALARAGDRIMLAAGDYWEDVQSVRDGTPDAPIWIIGSTGATLRGAGRSRMFEINHSHIILMNLIFDGKAGAGSQAEDYRDKLLYVKGKTLNGVSGLRILNIDFRNAGGECLRLKYFARQNEIAHSRFQNCGVWDFVFNQGGKNGEAVYIGTAPEQLDRNPTPDPDASNSNWVHHNWFDTQGNECVDIKESAAYNLVEHNECSGQRDPKSGGLSVRGNYNILRFNLVDDNSGAGIRLGGDTALDGIYNEVYGNTLRDNEYAGLKIMAQPQAVLCGNIIEPANRHVVRGKYAAGVDPTVACTALP